MNSEEFLAQMNTQNFRQALESMRQYFPEIVADFNQLADRLDTLEGYMSQLRDVIKLPPMFPANPEDEEYFYDEKSGDQFKFHKAEDEWDDDYWYDIKTFNKVTF